MCQAFIFSLLYPIGRQRKKNSEGREGQRELEICQSGKEEVKDGKTGQRQIERQIDVVKKLIKWQYFALSPNRIGLQPHAVCAQRREINNLSVRLVTLRSLTPHQRLLGILTRSRDGSESREWQRKTEREMERYAAFIPYGKAGRYVSLLKCRSGFRW